MAILFLLTLCNYPPKTSKSHNSFKEIYGALATAIISCYILGQRLGIEHSFLDENVIMKLEQIIKREPEADKLYGDYSAYMRYLRGKRGEKG